MTKTYHFLSGLPRSGNTLLSALLNQNPIIYSTPQSPLPAFIWDMANSSQGMEHLSRNKENQIRTDTFLLSFFDNFYQDVKEPIIIEREKAWGTPANLSMIKRYITPTPKIIFTVRDVLEILASYIELDSNFLDSQILNGQYYSTNYRSKKDMICEHLMSTNGTIEKALLALAPAFWEENKGIYHIVEFNDLISKPKETMSKIYEFLEIPYYEHNFTKINKLEKDNDEALGLPKNLHYVKKSLSKSKTDINVLSDYIRHKYSNMEFWRDNSLMKVRGKDF